jgi:hypothetical protein
MYTEKILGPIYTFLKLSSQIRKQGHKILNTVFKKSVSESFCKPIFL